MIKARITAESQAMLTVPGTDPDGDQHEEEAILGIMASDAETLKHKSFAACTPDELAALRRIMAGIRLTPPKRRTRRTSSRSLGPLAGHAPDDPGVDADARRARRAVRGAAGGSGCDRSSSSSTSRGRWRTTHATFCSSHIPPNVRRRRSRCSASGPGSPVSRGRWTIAGPITRCS